jgi:ABC-2 type transport system ATP-binding protein
MVPEVVVVATCEPVRGVQVDCEPRLVCRGLSRSFGSRVAVDDVSFTIGRGERFGLLGPNGAGKTTTISMICGLIVPDHGSVCVEGFASTDVEAKRLVGYVPQEIALYPTLTARENLRFFAVMYGVARRRISARLDDVLELVGLAERANDRVGSFSGGMKRRLNIGVALLHEPSLLVLDEPTAGVDPQSRHSILSTIRDLSVQSGVSVLYTTHYMEEAQRLCDRIAVLDEGRKIAEGTYDELVALGGENSRLRFATATTPLGFGAELWALPGVVTVAQVDDGYEMVVGEPGAVFPHLLALANACGVVITKVTLTEPDLEAVFLHLTGKALRD